MILAVESLLVLLLLTDLWLLGSGRLWSCITVIAAQGALLGALPLLIPVEAPWWRLVLQAGICLGLKGIAFPVLLLRAARHVHIRREVQPFVGYSPSLLIGVLFLALSLLLGSRLHVSGGQKPLLLVPVAFFTALTGLFLIVARRSAIMQVVGYLAMENGISAFGMALAEREPLLVEMGTFLDAFVAVFVMGITIFHINREFDHIDSARLSALKD